MIFSFPRHTFNERVSKNRMSTVDLFTDHPKMLTNLLKTRTQELQEVLAAYKFEHGLDDIIMVNFRQTDGKPVSRKMDGSVKEFKSIDVEEKNDIPSVEVVVRLV